MPSKKMPDTRSALEFSCYSLFQYLGALRTALGRKIQGCGACVAPACWRKEFSPSCTSKKTNNYARGGKLFSSLNFATKRGLVSEFDIGEVKSTKRGTETCVTNFFCYARGRDFSLVLSFPKKVHKRSSSLPFFGSFFGKKESRASFFGYFLYKESIDWFS